MAMTAAEAADALRVVSDSGVELLDEQLADAAARVAEKIRPQWPVDTGRSQSAWRGEGPAVVNDAPYASDVHDGLAAELLPPLIAAEQQEIEDQLDEEIQPLAEGRRR